MCKREWVVQQTDSKRRGKQESARTHACLSVEEKERQCVRERARVKERAEHRDRETERQRDRETETQRHRGKERQSRGEMHGVCFCVTTSMEILRKLSKYVSRLQLAYMCMQCACICRYLCIFVLRIRVACIYEETERVCNSFTVCSFTTAYSCMQYARICRYLRFFVLQIRVVWSGTSDCVFV